MKEIILQILHYIWSRKENIYSIYKEIKSNSKIKIDGKVNMEEILEYFKLIKKSGLIINPEDDEKVFLWAIDTMGDNPHKKLVQYDQSSWSCVIYAVARAFTYNTGIILTKDEVEGIKNYAKSKGWWKDKQGMTFRNWLRALAGWLKENKGIEIKYDRVAYGSPEYQERKAQWYACMLGGYMTKKYITDFNTDGIINANYSWDEKKKYWHAFTEEEKFTDNYPSRLRHNRYTNKMFQVFAKNSYMFWYAYFIFVDGEFRETVETVEYNKVWPYRKLAGDSVISDKRSLIETIRTGTDDEAVACLEILASRK